MNERIKELAEQAGVNLSSFQFSGTPIKYEVSESDLQKFAELLIRECAALATKEYDNKSAIHGNDLLEHFGVE